MGIVVAKITFNIFYHSGRNNMLDVSLMGSYLKSCF